MDPQRLPYLSASQWYTFLGSLVTNKVFKKMGKKTLKLSHHTQNYVFKELVTYAGVMYGLLTFVIDFIMDFIIDFY